MRSEIGGGTESLRSSGGRSFQVQRSIGELELNSDWRREIDYVRLNMMESDQNRSEEMRFDCIALLENALPKGL